MQNSGECKGGQSLPLLNDQTNWDGSARLDPWLTINVNWIWPKELTTQIGMKQLFSLLDLSQGPEMPGKTHTEVTRLVAGCMDCFCKHFVHQQQSHQHKIVVLRKKLSFDCLINRKKTTAGLSEPLQATNLETSGSLSSDIWKFVVVSISLRDKEIKDRCFKL